MNVKSIFILTILVTQLVGCNGRKSEDTSREIPTIMPPASELPDSHESPTLAGPDAVIDDFVTAPNWESKGDPDFGYSKTNYTISNTSAGEIGGTFTRAGEHMFYAQTSLDSTVSFSGAFFASGKLRTPVIDNPNHELAIGFFDPENTIHDEIRLKESVYNGVARVVFAENYLTEYPGNDVLRVFIEGPGFQSASLTLPQMVTGSNRSWELSYSPVGNGTLTFQISGRTEVLKEFSNLRGELSAGEESGKIVVRLKEEERANAISPTAFGFQSLKTSDPQPGIRRIDFYIDDLSFTGMK